MSFIGNAPKPKPRAQNYQISSSSNSHQGITFAGNNPKQKSQNYQISSNSSQGMSFIGKERRKDQEDRKIEEIFQEFVTWVTESMEIRKQPYIRVIAVFQGVKA